jgi:hypothetical protein
LLAKKYIVDIGYNVSIHCIHNKNQIFKLDKVKLLDSDFNVSSLDVDEFCLRHNDFIEKYNSKLTNESDTFVLSFDLDITDTFWRNNYSYYILQFKDLEYFNIELIDRISSGDFCGDKYFNNEEYIILGLPKDKLQSGKFDKKVDDCMEFVMANVVYEFSFRNRSVNRPILPALRANVNGIPVNLTYSNKKFYVNSITCNMFAEYINNLRSNYISGYIKSKDCGYVGYLTITNEDLGFSHKFGNVSLDVTDNTETDGDFTMLFDYLILDNRIDGTEVLALPSDCRGVIIHNSSNSSKAIKINRIILNSSLDNVDLGYFPVELSINEIYLSKSFNFITYLNIVNKLLGKKIEIGYNLDGVVSLDSISLPMSKISSNWIRLAFKLSNGETELYDVPKYYDDKEKELCNVIKLYMSNDVTVKFY